MSQFCEHGREVYCPKCEKESTMTTPDQRAPLSIDDIDPVRMANLAAGIAIIRAEKEGDAETMESLGHVVNGHIFEAVFTVYRNFVLVGADKKADSFFKDTKEHHKALGAVGLAGEGGEVLDLWKKQFFHTKEPENYRDKVLKELGDVMWYFVLKCAAEGITVDEVVYENMRKLVLRYPERHPELVAMFTDKA